MLVGLTYSLSGVMGLTVLMGVYIGAIYGGSITAITINVPGTGSAAATCLDGYPLALKGQGASAIRITRAASIFGTFVGAIALMFITPVLASLALMFTSAEYTTLTLFGILICGSVTAKDLPIKGMDRRFHGRVHLPRGHRRPAGAAAVHIWHHRTDERYQSDPFNDWILCHPADYQAAAQRRRTGLTSPCWRIPRSRSGPSPCC